MIAGPREPSAASVIGPIAPAPSAPSTTAPAPSPNRCAVFGSSKSSSRVRASAPITRILSARPVSIWPAAMRRAARKPRAGGADVHRAGALGAQLVGDQRRRVRRDLVLAHRRDEHEVDVVGLEPGVRERAAGGPGGHVAQALARGGAAARLHAGALDDPGVVDAEAAGERGVRHDLGRAPVAEADDAGGPLRRERRAVAGRLAGDRAQVGRERGAMHWRAPSWGSRPSGRR